MKRLIAIPLMLLSLWITSQNGLRIPEDEHAIINIHMDYANDKQGGYGPDIVMEFGYSGFVEAKIGFEYFPALYGGYTDVHGAIGFKLVHGRKEQWNYYVGVRLAAVWRGGDGAWKPIIGFEAQWTYDINDWLATGVRYTYDKRYDMEIFDWPVKSVSSGFIILTFKLKRL